MPQPRENRYRRGLVLLTTVVVLALLAGCVEVRVASDFEPDGSASHSIAATVDRAAAEDQLAGSQLDLEQIERAAESAGLEAERIDESERVGVRVSAEAEDNEDLSEVLSELFAPLGGRPNQLNAFSGGFITAGDEDEGGTYRLELTIDADALNPMNSPEFDDGDGPGGEFDASSLDQFLDMTYTVNMPGEITDHNGDETGPGQVQWEIPTQGTETFTAASEEGSGMPLALIIGIGAGVLALALLVLGGLTLMRGQSTPTSAASQRERQG